MAQVVIENPVINSAFVEPRCHFKFTDDGITDEIAQERRLSAYFLPIPAPKTKGKQLEFETEWLAEREQPNEFINEVRQRVRVWRELGHPGVTLTTSRLLEHWTSPDRERRLFFCQIEAVETAIYVAEVAERRGDNWIENRLREFSLAHNPDLFRMAVKMATGSGKTVVMAMLIAWHTLNKVANPKDSRFGDSFLVVTPGITIKDRLRVLLPSDPENYYRKMDLVPEDLREELQKAKVLVTNYHAFIPREKVSTSKTGKIVLTGGKADAAGIFTETPEEMVRRVCREFGPKKNLIVINDEAHHCYRSRPSDKEKLSAEDREEAKEREKEARVWISGLEAVKKKLGVPVVYDLSATPFFLRGSGYSEGTLFPWVVSDFSLIDAIECGIVKVPRVPVADDSNVTEVPTYRNIWIRIRDHLPKKGRKTEEATLSVLGLPKELEGALRSLYANYRKHYVQWEEMARAAGAGQALTPPVFIVVCNNTNVSKLVFDWIAGWEKPVSDGSSVLVPGNLDLFSNVEGDRWTAWPNTILVDSKQLESGEAMTPEFKKIAHTLIEEFKDEYRIRFPGRDPDALTDEDLLREVMNTIGKPGKLGEQVKCVVSVSMLTEGWDANTVTHILGVRAFSTQLLCEQVIGRGLRRTNYAPDENDMFPPEYAEVYGVPFSFIPTAGGGTVRPPQEVHRVRGLAERSDQEITFPRLVGYRYDLGTAKLSAQFTQDSMLTLSTEDLPTRTEVWPIVGEKGVHTLDELKDRRMQEVEFLLAKLTLEKYFRADGEKRPGKTEEHHFDSEVQSFLFPQVLAISRDWVKQCVVCKDKCFPQLLLLVEYAHDAADKMYAAIVQADPGERRLKPILQPYDTIGSTRYVDFDTTRPVYATAPSKCQVSHVVMDSSWEGKVAEVVENAEDMPEVVSYVKNQGLGFYIPYTINGEQHRYLPDFIIKLATADGEEVNLILEVSGQATKEKGAKTSAARNLWVPAINNHGAFGNWGFLEVTDPWDAANTIRAFLAKTQPTTDSDEQGER